MSQDTNVENLIINKLTRAQYESIATPDPTQLYFITDDTPWGMPDYANKVSFSNDTKIQLPVDALVSVGCSNGGAGWVGVDLWIYDTDGTTELWYGGNTATYASAVSAYVPKGLYVKASVGGSSQYRWYIPLKGAN